MHVCLGTRMPSCMCGVRGQLSGVISLLPPWRSCRGTQVTRFTGRNLYTDIVNVIINIILVARLAHARWYFSRLLSLRVKVSCNFSCPLYFSPLLSSPSSFFLHFSHGVFVCTPESEYRNHPVRHMATRVYDFSLLISKKSSRLDKLPDKSNFCQLKKGGGCLFVCLLLWESWTLWCTSHRCRSVSQLVAWQVQPGSRDECQCSWGF